MVRKIGRNGNSGKLILNKSVVFEFYVKGNKTYQQPLNINPVNKMKRYQMVIFFSIVLTIYSLINIYIYYKGYRSLPVLQENRMVLCA